MDINRIYENCKVLDKEGNETRIEVKKSVKNLPRWILNNYIVIMNEVKLTVENLKRVLEGGEVGLLKGGVTWLEEEREQLKNRVDEELKCKMYNDIDWKKIEQDFQRPLKSCQKVYNDLVPVNDRIKRDIDYLLKLESELELKRCVECERVYYTSKEWKGELICETCHVNKKDEIDKMWECVKLSYKMNGVWTKACEVCGDEGKHYDHKDIFEKELAISTMIDRGRVLEEILEERNKCRLLCRRCHGIMSQYEREYGLINFKKGKEVMEDEELREKMVDLQNKLYAKVKWRVEKNM